MTTQERSFQTVMSELRYCNMHGAYLMLMAEADSIRTFRALHEESLPEHCRLLRDDFRILEAAWTLFHGTPVKRRKCVRQRMNKLALREMIEEARRHIVYTRRQQPSHMGGHVEWVEPVEQTADLIQYYIMKLTHDRSSANYGSSRGNVRDPNGRFSVEDATASVVGVGITTDFVMAVNNKYLLESQLYTADYVGGIKISVTIRQRELTESLTHALLSGIPSFQVERDEWCEERGEIILIFTIHGDELKGLLTTEGNVYKATDAFLPTLNEKLKGTNIRIMARSDFFASAPAQAK